MPELPEVETMRRGITPVLGLRIASVAFPRGRCRPISVQPSTAAVIKGMRGGEFSAVHRFGKRVALELASATAAERRYLVIEPRMTGLLLVAPPPTQEHVRLELAFSDPISPPRIFWDRRGLGTLRLLDAAGLDAACGPRRLGPDGLVIGPDDLRARLGKSRRAIKVALLDQRAVAGIGNIYAAEILFRVGIDPRTPCDRLKGASWEAIATTSRDLLATAVEMEGSTIGDETYRTADNRPGRFQSLHQVYGREGSPCGACGGSIVRIVQAQRATFYCPACQPRQPGRRRKERSSGGAPGRKTVG